MNIVAMKGKPTWVLISLLLATGAFTVLILNLAHAPRRVSAHSGEVFGPACGAAFLDGKVDPAEWSGASTQTFLMDSPSGAAPFTASLYVMNSGSYLYLGITINDDEFSTIGTWLPHGDGFRIDFDNDHDGLLSEPGDDVLDIFAGSPQFEDDYIYMETSSESDVIGGGTSNGSGAASRMGNLNHFELRHPLCSGDSLDFCLHPTDAIGFRLEYLDAQADGSFGSSQFFPVFGESSEADIVIGQCSIADIFIYLPLITK
jgi:hypothetical protein